MKQKIGARILVLSLVLALVFSLVACDSAKTDSTTGTPQNTTTGGSETPEDGPLTPYEEPIEITWAVQASAVQQFIDGDTYDDNVWSRLIKEKLNIDVKVGLSADISTDAYNNRMNLLLATGEFPDVLRYSNRTFFRQAQEAGYIQPIGDVFDEYATDAVKAYQENYPDSFDGGTIDGELYGFPYMNDNFHQAAFLWIRDDWLANTGSEAPSTVEEMVELARTFTNEDPDGDGTDNTYGFGLAGSVVQSNYGTLLGLAGAYGVPGYGNTGVFYRDDSGEMTFAYLQPGMKEALTVARDMYAEGLIDPEFTAEDVATMEEDITNGTLGMMYHMNWGTWHPFNYSYQNEGVLTRPYPIPTVDGYEPKMGINSNKTGDLFMVSSECENPEAIIKILNLYEQTAISSDDPEDFQTYWANEQYRLCPAFIGIPTELFAPQLHAALEAGSPEGLAGTALEYYNYVVGFEDGSLADDTNAYGTWGQMYVENFGGSMKIALDYKDKGWLVTNEMANDLPEIWKQNSSVLGDMVDTTFVDIIVGNRPVDDFDQFVDEWLAAGGQQTLDEMETLYPAN